MRSIPASHPMIGYGVREPFATMNLAASGLPGDPAAVAEDAGGCGVLDFEPPGLSAY